MGATAPKMTHNPCRGRAGACGMRPWRSAMSRRRSNIKGPNEQATRRSMIDPELVAAGWNVGPADTSTEEVGKEVSLTTLPTASGELLRALRRRWQAARGGRGQAHLHELLTHGNADVDRTTLAGSFVELGGFGRHSLCVARADRARPDHAGLSRGGRRPQGVCVQRLPLGEATGLSNRWVAAPRSNGAARPSSATSWAPAPA
jgi:hypothetical protein